MFIRINENLVLNSETILAIEFLNTVNFSTHYKYAIKFYVKGSWNTPIQMALYNSEEDYRNAMNILLSCFSDFKDISKGASSYQDLKTIQKKEEGYLFFNESIVEKEKYKLQKENYELNKEKARVDKVVRILSEVIKMPEYLSNEAYELERTLDRARDKVEYERQARQDKNKKLKQLHNDRKESDVINND